MLAGEAQIAVGIVFNDRELVLLGQFKKSLPPLQGHGDAGRILKGRNEVSEFWSVFFNSLFRFFDQKTGSIHRDGRIERLVGVKGLDRAKISGIFDQYPVLGIKKHLPDQIKTLLGAVREENLIRLAGKAVPAKPLTQELFKRPVAFRQIVLERRRAIGP